MTFEVIMALAMMLLIIMATMAVFDDQHHHMAMLLCPLWPLTGVRVCASDLDSDRNRARGELVRSRELQGALHSGKDRGPNRRDNGFFCFLCCHTTVRGWLQRTNVTPRNAISYHITPRSIIFHHIPSPPTASHRTSSRESLWSDQRSRWELSRVVELSFFAWNNLICYLLFFTIRNHWAQ